MTCEECEELLGAYVLDVATLEERTAVEQHLAGCARCSQELQEMRSAVEMLPLAVPQIDPPSYMKDRILSAIRESSPTERQPIARPFRPVAVPASGAGMRIEQGGQVRRQSEQQGQSGQRQQPTPLSGRRAAATQTRRSRQWLMPLVAAAAILFLLLSGGLTAWNVSLQHQVTGLQASATSATANSVTLTTYGVQGTSAAPGATGQVLYLPKQHVTVIVMHGLPQLAGTQVYQGWLIKGKQTTSIGLLNVQPDGTATVNYNGDIQGFDAAAVSKEQGPTATPNAPKGAVVAVGALKATNS